MTEKKTKTPVTQESLSQELEQFAKDVAAPKKKMGRPTIFTQDLADTICVRLSLGESLRSICRDDHMPAQQTVYVWLNRDKAFQDQYARAREEQADTHADEIIAIADEDPEVNPIRDKDGNVIDIKIDSGYVAYQKQRIEARKWTAAKLRPKKYGERVTHAGDDESPLVLENNMNVFGELLKAIKLQRQTEG